MNNNLSVLEKFFLNDFWPDYFFINNYPILGIFWNLALLIVPFLFSILLYKYWLKGKMKTISSKIVGGFIFAGWLLFIPNTAYIITDVRHLVDGCYLGSFYHICPEKTWLIMFFFMYALIGWLAFVYLLNHMKKNINLILGEKYSKFYIWTIIPLISLGVLLGLLQRWNSWEFFYNPGDIFSDAIIYLSDWIYFRNWLSFTIGLYILYFIGNKIFKK